MPSAERHRKADADNWLDIHRTAHGLGLKTNCTTTVFTGNATYDVYFTHDVTLRGGPPDKFLMVWLDAKDFNPIKATIAEKGPRARKSRKERLNQNHSLI